MRAAFVINPVAGRDKLGQTLAQQIPNWVAEEGYSAQVFLTQGPKHATQLATEAASQGFDVVVAVGGDGTVREVSQGLLGRSVAAGIIPIGSGNGIARHLGIPLVPRLAIAAIPTLPSTWVDVGMANGKEFIMVCGLGFDAEVANLFAELPSRGLQSYVTAGVKAFLNRKPFFVEITWDSGQFAGQALMLTTANSSQFGNNAFIAPHASMRDGLLNINLLHPVPEPELAELVGGVFTRNIGRLPSVWQQTASKVRFTLPEPISYHLDGEPMGTEKDFDLQVQHKALRMLYGGGPV